MVSVKALLAYGTKLWSFQHRMVEDAHVQRPGWRERRLRLVALLALGATLSRRGIMAIFALAIAILTTVGMSVFVVVLAVQSRSPSVFAMPILASSTLAWGGGFMLAFASAMHALRKDRDEGVRDLLMTRSTSLRSYLVARVGGLAMLLAMVTGGGTLVVGLVATAAHVATAARTIETTAASIAYATAFSFVMAPVALAALGARSRIGGYAFLLLVVMLPEVVMFALARANVLSADVADVLAIPSALRTLRASLMAGEFDMVRALRALVALAVFGAIAAALVRRDAVMVTRPEIDG